MYNKMSIKDLYEELNFPSKTKLKQVAKKRKIEYTEEQLDGLMNWQREILSPAISQ